MRSLHSWKAVALAWLIAIGFAVGLARCGSKANGACAKNDDCQPAYICSAGACARLCNIDGQCEINQQCSNGLCRGQACNATGDCHNNFNNCLGAAVCTDGTCEYTPLASQTPCVLEDKNGSCADGRCLVTDCSQNADCPQSYYCSATNACAPTSVLGVSCASDYECSSGHCQPTADGQKVCAATDCGSCGVAGARGQCVNRANGTTSDGCSGYCTNQYAGGGASVCCSGTCACDTGAGCP